MIEGLGPNTPVEQSEAGGLQSKLPFRCDLLDGQAMLRLAAILEKGARKYAPDNWRLIDCRSHINHALSHLFGWLAGDRQDPHLDHAFCRLMMAVATDSQAASQSENAYERSLMPPVQLMFEFMEKSPQTKKPMKPFRIGLSGPMTGLPDWNFPLFNKTADNLRRAGFDVFNPAETDGGSTDKPRPFYLKAALKGILDCDMVVLLPDWEKSVGASLEVLAATEADIPVYESQTGKRIHAWQVMWSLRVLDDTATGQ